MLSGGCRVAVWRVVEADWGCGEVVWRVLGGCLDDVGRLSAGYGEGAGRFSGVCGEVVWEDCLQGVDRLSGGCQVSV